MIPEFLPHFYKNVFSQFFKIFWYYYAQAGYRQFARNPWDAKNMQDAMRVYALFRVVYAALWDKFLMSHVSNCLVIEVVIMHETKEFFVR